MARRFPVPTLRGVSRSLFGPEAADTRQSLIALGISTLTSIGAGLTLGAIEETLRELRGLLVLVPAAIAMRGNIFGALGSRLSTSLHTGTFSLSRRADTVVGQNVLAAIVLTLMSSVALGVLAKTTAVAFDVPDTISVVDLVVISTVGGLLSSFVVLAVTLALAGGSTRFGWDLDNVTAPLVSAVGDVVTLPALFVATSLVGISFVTPLVALASAVAAIVALVGVARSGRSVLRGVVRESVPILLVAGLLTVVAGVAIEKQLETFSRFQVLLVLVPAFLAGAGAIGGILSSRLSSKLHLGLVEPAAVPDRVARADIGSAIGLAVPVFVALGFLSHLAATTLGQSSPGLVDVVSVAVLGGVVTTALVVAIGYYGTIAAVRLGADPDNVGIPLVTSTVDLVGAYALVIAVSLVGLS
ncbi:MAG: magnesium transporter [Actinomycetota bacterium]